MAGADDRFRALFDSDFDRAVDVAGRITGEPEVGTRIVRYAFARAFASWRRIARRDAPTAWLYRKVIALSIEVAESVEGRESPLVEPPLVDAPLRHRHLGAALSALGKHQRDVVVLRYLGGCSPDEVGARLALSVDEVAERAAEGLAALRDELADQGERATKERRRG